jgi:molybdopterin converting factor small subunit
MIEMVRVRISSHLTRHFAIPAECEAAGRTVGELIADLNAQYPGVADYILHETGELRQHVNVFVGDHVVHDRRALSDSLDDGAEVLIMQALSGG